MSDSSGRLLGVGAVGEQFVDCLGPLVRLSGRSPVSTGTLAGLCAFVPVALVTLSRVVHNAPGTLPIDLTVFAANAAPVAIVGPAVAALLLATVEASPVGRVGLTFAGGFGLLPALSSTAWLPAAVGIAAGGVVVVAARIERTGTASETLAVAGVSGLLVTALVASLLATLGVHSATLRPFGSMVALLGLGATPILTGRRRTSLLAGGLAGLLTFGVATSVPYVAGAVLLVGGRVVGAPLGLVVLAVAGGVTALASVLERGDATRALGIGLLLVAGVPASLLGALAVVVGVALLPEPGADPAGLTFEAGGDSS